MSDFAQAREAALKAMAEACVAAWGESEYSIARATVMLDALLALRLTRECEVCHGASSYDGWFFGREGRDEDRRKRGDCPAGCDAGRVAGEKVLTVLGMEESDG